jgi:hypothetical protein
MNEKMRYMLPYEKSDKIDGLLERLENEFGRSCLFAVETASLENAYIRIVE